MNNGVSADGPRQHDAIQRIKRHHQEQAEKEGAGVGLGVPTVKRSGKVKRHGDVARILKKSYEHDNVTKDTLSRAKIVSVRPSPLARRACGVGVSKTVRTISIS